PQLRQIYASEENNLTPTTDDRPFFNQHLRWSALRFEDLVSVFKKGREGRLALEDAPVAETALIVFVIQAALLGALMLVLPLRAIRKQPALRKARKGAFLVYFAALGIGFMLVELGLVQRLTVFIGPPTIAFATVVAVLLVGSGLGSRLSASLDLRRALPVGVGAALTLTIVSTLVAPLVTEAALGAPLPARLALAIALVAPVGIALGTPFPLGLRLVESRAPGLIPWVWGVNGFASVVASAASLLLATLVGFSGVLLGGAVAYAVALVTAVLLLNKPPKE
ncbi:MAG: hypothetical protein V2A73_01540, partial [Pseudomonadota bacterium]